MSELFKEMCSLSGKLSGFVDYIKEKKAKENLLSLFFIVNELCEKIAKKEFDENDDFYLDTIEKIMDTVRVINEFKENKILLTEVFDHLTSINDNVKKISGTENEE